MLINQQRKLTNYNYFHLKMTFPFQQNLATRNFPGVKSDPVWHCRENSERNSLERIAPLARWTLDTLLSYQHSLQGKNDDPIRRGT